MEKLVRDLVRGDVLELDGGTATVASCKRSTLLEAAPGLGGSWEIEYRDNETGETGRHIATGLATVFTSGKGQS